MEMRYCRSRNVPQALSPSRRPIWSRREAPRARLMEAWAPLVALLLAALPGATRTLHAQDPASAYQSVDLLVASTSTLR